MTSIAAPAARAALVLQGGEIESVGRNSMMPPAPSIGSTIAGRYELRDLLRECASRQVFRAFDLEVEAFVALWWMRSSLFSDEAQRSAFEARAQGLKAVTHPHLIRMFQVGRHAVSTEGDAGVFIALQLGTSAELDEALDSGEPADEGNFLRYAEGLIAAVQGAHDAGKLHGFLTPSDIVEVAGQVKLCGVGLFTFLQPNKAVALWDGEARYLAPELAEGIAPSLSADWYSVGVILLELATGNFSQTTDESLVWLSDEDPARAAALAPALLSDPVLRGTGADLLLAIRLAWNDPRSDISVDETTLPTVIDNQGRFAQNSPLETLTSHSPIRDVGAVRFLGDDYDEETVLQRKPAPPAEGVVATPAIDDDAIFDDATIIESSPNLKLEMVSRKPVMPTEHMAERNEAVQKSPIRPVLRPLSSLAPAQEAQSLGTLAPPKQHSSSRGYWIVGLIALLLGALTAGLFIALTH